MLLTQNGWWQNLIHNSITEAVEIKGLWNLQDTALEKWALKNAASRSCFMSLGLKGWRVILMFEPMPCSTQFSVQISFTAQKTRHCQLFTSNALASCSNESDPLWTEEEGKPLGLASKKGQPWASLLTWSLHLYMFFALVFLFDYRNRLSFPGLPPPWSFSLGWHSRECHIPTPPRSNSV